MKFTYQYTGKQNLLSLIRNLGYHQSKFNDSYVRLLGRDNYPRFHLYLDSDGRQLNFKLHLDQKKASYSGQTAHSGEYDSELIAQEKERILSIIKNL